MDENFICERCGSEVVGIAHWYDNEMIESHYDCNCGFKWRWAYGQHLFGSTVLEEQVISMRKLGWDIETIQAHTGLIEEDILALEP